MLIDLLESSKAIGLCPMGILAKLFHTHVGTLFLKVLVFKVHLFCSQRNCIAEQICQYNRKKQLTGQLVNISSS